jgi:hypothetical protein
MAGYSTIYIFGGEGGFLASDGISPIALQILVGRSDREWLEPHYFDSSIGPMGKLRVIIPSGPDHKDALLDACIAFFSGPFRSCPTFADVEAEVGARERIDFDQGEGPASWARLREEARPRFAELNCWRGELEQVLPDPGSRGTHG